MVAKNVPLSPDLATKIVRAGMKRSRYLNRGLSYCLNDFFITLEVVECVSVGRLLQYYKDAVCRCQQMSNTIEEVGSSGYVTGILTFISRRK